MENFMEKRHFCLLVNPTANHGETRLWVKKVEEKLQSLGVSFHTVIPDSVIHAKEITQRMIEKGEAIAVMGGDGSIRTIASIVNAAKGLVTIIPTGRGNDLARVLHIPLDPLAACEVLQRGKEIKIDMGLVNDEPFLSMCSVGFDSIASQIANTTKFFHSRVAYIYAGLRTLATWKPATFHITIDGVNIEHVGYSIAVANSKSYGGGMLLAPDASINDGLFDVVLIGDVPKSRFLINFPRVYKGTHINEPGFKIIRGKEILIETDPKFVFCTDGDLIAHPPAKIHILPQTLRVLGLPSG